MMQPLLMKTMIPVLLVLGVAFLVVGGKQLSLASDVGLSEADVCATLAEHGGQAVQRLNASGFPHASTSQTETYRLLKDDAPKAVVRIDWAAQAASCLPVTTEATTADIRMTSRAYASLTGEIRHVLATGELSGAGVGNWWNVYWGTSIHIPGNEAYEAAYKAKAARWAAGWLLTGGGTA